MNLNRTTAIIYYLIISALSVVFFVALIKVPPVIFVGVEDFALTTLLYLTCVLLCLKTFLYLADFFLIKLGIFSILTLENREVLRRIKEVERANKVLRSEINDLNNAKYEKR